VNVTPVFVTGEIGLWVEVVVTVISDIGKLGWLKGISGDKRMEIASVHYNVTSLRFIPYKLLLAWYDSLNPFSMAHYVTELSIDETLLTIGSIYSTLKYML